MGGPATMGAPMGIPMGGGPGAAAGPGGFGTIDPFLTGVAGNMLRQQGQSYLQRGQAFMQVRRAGWAGVSVLLLCRC